MSQDDLYFRYMTHAGYIGGPFDESAAKKKNYKPTGKKRKKKVKEDDMGIGQDLEDVQKSAWKASMIRDLEAARDRGYERSETTRKAAADKAAAERQNRKLQVADKYFKGLPKLLEDAVALGKKEFEFIPVRFSDVTQSGLGRYNPKSGTDVELVMELLNELDLIADIMGAKETDRDADAYVTVQV